MPSDFLLNLPPLVFAASGGFFLKAFLTLFLVFYLVLAILTLRQVQIMSVTLSTILAPHLKFVAILNLGASVAILLIVIGVF